MANQLLSIVVPVFNAEKYLDQCISSILNQTYQEFELILVNDGSTDRSLEICLRYEALDNRVKVLTQENRGASVSRRQGTDVAKGKYITYVDADDYLESSLYENVMPGCEKYDLTVFGWTRNEATATYLRSDPIAPGEYITEDDMMFLLHNLVNISLDSGKVHLKPGFSVYMMNKIFDINIAKSVFEKIDETLTLTEDHSFFYRYFLKCKSVRIIREFGYHYRIHKESICHRVDPKNSFLRDVSKFYYSIYPVFAKHPQSHDLLPQLQLKTRFLLNRAMSKMGFSDDSNLNSLFPFFDNLKDKAIILYGDETLGARYMSQCRKHGFCNVVALVAGNWQDQQKVGWDVKPVEVINSIQFDYIVLATYKEQKALEIRDELADLNVDLNKVLWKKPFYI